MCTGWIPVTHQMSIWLPSVIGDAITMPTDSEQHRLGAYRRINSNLDAHQRVHNEDIITLNEVRGRGDRTLRKGEARLDRVSLPREQQMRGERFSKLPWPIKRQ